MATQIATKEVQIKLEELIKHRIRSFVRIAWEHRRIARRSMHPESTTKHEGYKCLMMQIVSELRNDLRHAKQ